MPAQVDEVAPRPRLAIVIRGERTGRIATWVANEVGHRGHETTAKSLDEAEEIGIVALQDRAADRSGLAAIEAANRPDFQPAIVLGLIRRLSQEKL